MKVFLILTFILPMLVACQQFSSGNTIAELTNRSDECIDFLVVVVGGVSKEIRKLKVNQTITLEFEVPYDTEYSLDVDFSSGHKINAQLGYLTNGFSVSDSISVYLDRVEMKRLTIE